MFCKFDSRTWEVNAMLNALQIIITYTHLQKTDYKYEQITKEPTNQPTKQLKKYTERAQKLRNFELVKKIPGT
jgi:ribulose-5-phosphate 4-epimerase/fuculose-1-phosphate aldolase